MRFIFFICSVFLFSCAHKPVPVVVTDSKVMFLNGLYKQSIEVTYVKDGKSENHQFNGMLKKSDKEIYLYCYVGFGISLFKLKDNFKGPVDFVASDERIEKNKDFFLKMYPVIKEIILLQKESSRLKGNEMTLAMGPDHFPVHIKISSEQTGPVPKQIVIENAEHFRFAITNTDFDLETK